MSASNSTLAGGNGCPTLHGVLLSPYWVVLLSMVVVSGLAIAWNYGKRWAKEKAHACVPTELAEKLVGRRIAYSGVVGAVEAVSSQGEVVASYTMQEATLRVVVQGFTTRYPDCDGAACTVEGVNRLKDDPRDEWRGMKQRAYPLIDTGDPLPFNAIDEVAPGQWILEGKRSDFDRMRTGAKISLKMYESTEVKSLLLPAPAYARVMVLLNAAHMIYIGATLLPEYASSMPQLEYDAKYQRNGVDAAWSPLAPDGSSIHDYSTHWLRYEQFYVRALNSGLLTVGLTCWLATERVNLRVEQMELLRYTYLCLGFFAPILITHAIPALVVFPYLALGIGMMFAFYCVPWDRCIDHKLHPRRHALVEMTFQRFAILIALILVQTAVHCAVLMYDAHAVPISGADWSEVVSTEWDLRSTSCYFESLTHTASHMLSFLSWL